MTNILTLPLLNMLCTVGSNEDWLDGISFTASDSTPLDLTGIAFNLTVSQTAGGTNYISGSLGNGILVTSGSPPSILSVSVLAANRSLSAGPYYFSINAVADGHAIDVVTGTLIVRQS